MNPALLVLLMPMTLLEPRWQFSAAFSQARLDTDLRVDTPGGARGTETNAEKDLGLSKSRIEPRFSLRYRPSRRHELEAGYQVVRRSASHTLDAPVQFANETFGPGEVVDTHLKTDRGFVAYRYAWLASNTWQAGPSAGAGVLLVDATVEGASKASTETMGALGAYGRHQAGVRWTFEADARYGRSSRSGSTWDAAGAARWHASQKFALELGYGASVADLDLDGGAVRYSVQNLRIGMVLTR